ncbi:MAG: YidC/Oxa1 family insertase periplasmic-domain containing protein [Phycisphaeraceae bacterium]|nr:YidC/Oxa1 family insertase periplasmic-domain containing protein [Phycisphaeraceae bacterium]
MIRLLMLLAILPAALALPPSSHAADAPGTTLVAEGLPADGDTPVSSPDDSGINGGSGGVTGSGGAGDNDPAASADESPPFEGDAPGPAAEEPTEGEAAVPARTTPPAAPASEEAPGSQLLEGLRARQAAEQQTATLGSVDPTSAFLMQADISMWGAGVQRIMLTEHHKTVRRTENYVIQAPVRSGDAWGLPMAARQLTILDGEREIHVPLGAVAWQREGDVVRTESADSVTYSVIIENQRGQRLLKITRRIELRAGAYHLDFHQTLESFSPRPIRVEFILHGVGDVPEERSYLGEKRDFAAGFFDTRDDPARRHVYSKGTWMPRGRVISDRQDMIDQRILEPGSLSARPFWQSGQEGRHLIWAAATNRYFAAVAALPIRENETERGRAVTPLDDRFLLGIRVVGSARPLPGEPEPGVLTVLRSRPIDLNQGDTVPLDVMFYTGPRKHGVFRESPYRVLGLDELLHYDLGGPCSFCTFQWLAHALIWFLRSIHSVLFDWGLAIIVLVLAVRLILHPLTKKSQISMTKMSKQMQALQPEIKKLKEKYKDDPKQLQQEQMKLFREKGVNPLNMLGCLPLFLQMPIWLALYSMLFFAIELRHQPAFYGVFQMLGDWRFLADLSEPDQFINFRPGESFRLPFIGVQMAYAFNILPILMAVFFFYQQKLMTPPAMTPEQAQQQKIMRIMMLFFPIFLWPAPAGLNLYILASSIGGTIDSLIVRRTVKRMEEAGTLFAKKERKSGGFMDRMTKAVQAQQEELAKRQAGAKPDKRSQRPGGKRKR